MKHTHRLTLLCAAMGAWCLAFDAGAATLPAVPAPFSVLAKTQAKPKNASRQSARPTVWMGLALSPDGKNLAWLSFGKHGMNLEVGTADAMHGKTVQMPKAAGNCHVGRPLWSPDGSELAFLGRCGKSDTHQQNIFLVKVGGNKLVAHQLTHLDGYVHGLSWAPNGKQLGILYVEGDTHTIGATAASKPRIGVIGKTGVEHQQMALVNAATGKAHTATPKSLFVYEYSFSSDAKRLAYIAAPPPGANNWWTAKLYTQSVNSSQPQQLVDAWTASGTLHHMQMAQPRFSPDGKTIAFIGGLMSDQGVTGGDLYLVPSHGGKAVDVSKGIHFSPSWFTWSGNDHLLTVSYAGAGSRLSLFALHGMGQSTHKALFNTPAAIRGLALSDDHTRFEFLHSTFNQAPEIYAGQLALDAAGQPTRLAGTVHAITHANANLKRQWGKGVEINWHNEGYDVSGWLLLPAHYDPHKSYPMIVNVHGGPVWAFRAHWPMGGQLAKFSQKGYFVFMPNPRGSLGQGEKFTKAVRRDMGYGDLRDILAGVDAVEKQYSVDDNRLGLMGWSYGGFMSMFAPTQTHRFKAAVAGAGLSDWKSYYGENMIDQWMLPFFGASVYADPAVYAKSSAINFIKHDKTPTLIVVGQFDKECPAPQSFEMWHALRTMGVPTKLVVYAGEGHGFHKPKDMQDVARRTFKWFKTYLKPQQH